MAKLTRIVKTKPKTIKIGHGYYDLKLIREIINSLPDSGAEGKPVTITSHPGKYPSLDVSYPRGHFHLVTTNLPYYESDRGKIKAVHSLTYHQGQDQPAKTFSLLAVELKLR